MTHWPRFVLTVLPSVLKKTDFRKNLEKSIFPWFFRTEVTLAKNKLNVHFRAYHGHCGWVSQMQPIAIFSISKSSTILSNLEILKVWTVTCHMPSLGSAILISFSPTLLTTLSTMGAWNICRVGNVYMFEGLGSNKVRLNTRKKRFPVPPKRTSTTNCGECGNVCAEEY